MSTQEVDNEIQDKKKTGCPKSEKTQGEIPMTYYRENEKHNTD